jgi:hypothetical protein
MARDVRGIHWLAPTTVLVSFVAGIGLAVGHHFFYYSLHNQPTADSSQQYNNAIGTAFSFLVRAALVIAISTTYWQVFWKTLHHDLPLSTIDSLAGILGSLQEFLSLKTLKASPLLMALALLAWLIPVAVIFPPATLSVVPYHALNRTDIALNSPNFTNSEVFARTSTSYTGAPIGNGPPAHDNVRWDGPTSQLKRIMIGTAYQARLPPIAAPAENCSFELHFDGPAVQCDETEPYLVLGNVSAVTESPYYYLSWVPEASGEPPFGGNYRSGDTFSISDTLGARSSSTDTGAWAPNVFVAIRPSLTSEEWSVVNCSLYRSSYAVHFNYTNSDQDVTTFQAGILNPVTTDHWQSVGTDLFALSSNDIKPYFAAMDVLGSILTGTLWKKPGTFSLSSIDATDHTRILETSLAHTLEMLPLYTLFTSLQPPRNTSLLTLASSIEQLFLNMTISILAEPAFLAPQTTLTPVDSHRVYNAYSYNWRRLAMAYGIAIGSTLIAVLVGLYTIVTTGSSYTNKFSTIVRVSRSERLDVLIAPEDRLGQDPVPKHIAKAKFSVSDGTGYGSGTVSEATKLRSRSPGLSS